MSKSGKVRNKARRDAQKRSRRAANQARYAALVGTDANRKKKARNSAGRSRTVKHAVAFCGNLACARCHPEYNDPRTAPPGSSLYGKQWSSPKWRED